MLPYAFEAVTLGMRIPRCADVTSSTVQEGIVMKKMVLTLVAGIALLLSGCGDDRTATSTTPAVALTGSFLAGQDGNVRWSWVFTNGQFTGTDVTNSLHYSGTATALPSGFQKLLITTSDDPALATLPTTAYAMVMPGEAIVIKPSTQSDPTRAIVGAGLGHCPSADATYSWLTVPKNGWDATDYALGQTHFTPTLPAIAMTHDFDFFDGSLRSHGTPPAYTCTNGLIVSDTDPAVLAVSPHGVYLAYCGPVLSGLIGVVDPAINFTVNDLVGPGHHFRGMTFQNRPSGDQTTLVWAQGDHHDGFDLNTYTNVETNAISVDSATALQVTLGTANSGQRFTGTLTDAAGTHAFQYVVACLSNGKYVIFGFGYITTGGGNTYPYNLALLEQ